MERKKMLDVRRFGEITESFIKMAEYLSINGHVRKEVYEYSLKKIFYFFDVIEKHKNKERYDYVIDTFNTMAGVHGGEAEAINRHLSTIEFK